MFVEKLKQNLEEDWNVSVTENGALGYATTGKALLDLNYSVASLRSASEEKIIEKYIAAFAENKILATKWLFFARDVREGLGERRLFRTIIKEIAKTNPEIVSAIVELIPIYGRWDDLWCLLKDKNVGRQIYEIVDAQLTEDCDNYMAGKPISLLAKWMPSVNATSKDTKRMARKFAKVLGVTEREYRKSMAMLRKYLDVTEVKMSANQWGEIDYEKVPSKANLLYKNAFLKHDEERRREFLSKVSTGEAKINASVLYPHDIVHKYTDGYYHLGKKMDEAIEGLWKSLPDMVQGFDNTLVVADGSGSMAMYRVGNTAKTCLDVANSLAIYFAEHSSGGFKDKYITFSNKPQLVDFSHCNTLHEKLQVALSHREVSNTNIEATFELILDTAVKNHMLQEDMPANILIISDMEFDEGTTCGYGMDDDEKLFKTIEKKYEMAGYKLPRLVFWNVNSRTGTIPVKQNELGVALVSGFSTNICKMVMSSELDPYKVLLETLNSERYAPIEAALQ